MSVRRIRKEMDMSNQAPQQQQPMTQQAPANAQAPPQMQQQQEIPDHTHPEYDQMLVKLQEIEGQLQGLMPGGINQESLEDGKPKNDAGKPTGNQLPISDNQGNDDPKKTESYIRRLIREELTGVPERDVGKALDSSGPDNTQNIPQSKQPANGTAPSGGNFDSDDKTNKKDGDDTINNAPKPGSEFDKVAIHKNKMNQAKSLIEKAKALMKEANGEDPTKPNPGNTEKDPAKMDGSQPNKSPLGGIEELGGATADPEANVPNDKRPKLKESEGEDDELDFMGQPKPKQETLDKVYANLKKEMAQEMKGSRRESFVGLTARSNSNSQANHEEYVDTKKAVTNTMKEYLTKAGHSRALGFMVPPSTY